MTILITGANRGIGHGLYQSYKTFGQTVWGTSRDGAGDLLPLDVTDQKSLKSLADTLNEQPLDLLVCNAGVYLDKSEDLSTGYAESLWAQTFAANVTGVFQTIQTLLPNLRMAESGKIAIISSQMASQTRAPGGSYIYRASKAAALNLGRNLAADLRDEGISVGIYHPGWVKTDMGGASADITVPEAVAGLIQRFDALSLETTGCFETWDGREHAF